MQPIRANILCRGLGQVEGDPVVTAVVTDNRAAGPGSLFVCIRGARADGHDYAAKAVQAGACAVVAQHPVQGVPSGRCVLVQNPLDAMIRMGANYRAGFSPVLVGVTGSVGKTTTKEFCYAVFSAFGKTLKTEGNQNNEIGMPNTLFRLDGTTRYAVVEMGMQGLGEIEKLTLAARPCGAIITCIGQSHLEQLGTRENILKAKMEICAGLPDGAPLVLNADDDLLPAAKLPDRLRPVWFGIENGSADVRAVDIRQEGGGTRFVLSDREYGDFPAVIPTVGLHTVSDALAAYTAATRLGLDPARAAAALADYRTTGMRQHIVQKGGVTVVEDCYNASPDSMRAALAVLQGLPAKRHIALLGDMLELGAVSEQAHRQVGEWAAEAGVDLLIAYGPRSRAAAEAARAKGVTSLHCNTEDEVVGYVRQNVRPGDALLAKASHAMKLDDVLARFYQTL